MKRSEFLRKLVIGAAAVATAPKILAETFMPDPSMVVAPPIARRIKYAFKISTEALMDEDLFEAIINFNKVPLNAKPSKIEIGWDGDDFAKDMKTVILTYDHDN